jgi:hypothetical protein
MNEPRTQGMDPAGTSQSAGELLAAKGFVVRDPNGDRIGKVDDLYVGSDRQARYLAVRMGFFGMKMTFIPVQLVTTIDPEDKVVTVSASQAVAKDGPVFDRDHEFTPEDEAEIWQYYGLGAPVYMVTEFLIWEEAS